MTGHFCTHCGQPVEPGAHFCTGCGQVLGEGSSAAAPPPPPAPVAAATPPYAAGGGATPTAPGAVKPGGRTPLIVAIAVLATLLVAAIALVAVRGSGGDGGDGDVLLEAAAVEVPDPFTATASVDEAPLPAAAPTTTSAGATTGSTATTAPAASTGLGGGTVKGSAPGLYGGTRDKGSCDPERMISFLQENSTKAKAWAAVQGIAVSDIPTFVRSLTPVVLRRDTRVLNHGYRNGKATPRPAVLQAGTAVLVDDVGRPRVKCGCGNPLLDPRPVTTKTRYTGARWTGFDPVNVVVVRVDVKVTTFVLIDIRTGAPFARPVASSGSADAAATAPGGSTTTTVVGPTTTAAPDVSDSEGTSAPKLFEIASIAGVSNGPSAPSVATLPAARITAISTYHWNDATGATPGTIGLKATDGTLYGPWQATGLDGQGGVPNATWIAVTNERVPAGSYTVVDSSPGTWAYAPDTGGRGMVTIWGVAEKTSTTKPDTSATTAPSSDRSAQAVAAVEGSLCNSDPSLDDWRQYITGITAHETETDLYRVEVRIQLDSGAWTALFDADFATEDGPVIRAINSESAALLC